MRWLISLLIVALVVACLLEAKSRTTLAKPLPALSESVSNASMSADDSSFCQDVMEVDTTTEAKAFLLSIEGLWRDDLEPAHAETPSSEASETDDGYHEGLSIGVRPLDWFRAELAIDENTNLIRLKAVSPRALSLDVSLPDDDGFRLVRLGLPSGRCEQLQIRLYRHARTEALLLRESDGRLRKFVR